MSYPGIGTSGPSKFRLRSVDGRRALLIRPWFPTGMRRAGWWLLPTVCPLLLTPTAVRAQPVFAPLVPPPNPQSAQTFFSTNGMTAESILEAAKADPESGNPLRWGPFAAHPRVDYQYINASGIRQGTVNNPTNTVSTIQHLISPGVLVQMGPHWRVDAALSLNYYTEKVLSDTFGYHVGINGGVPYKDWVFGLGAALGSSETSQTETAAQTKQDTYSTTLTAVYGAMHRVSYDLSVSQNIVLTDELNDSYTWSTLNWLNYVVTPKTTVGVGLGGGYNLLEAGTESRDSTGTDSVFEQVQGRVVWHPRDRFSLSVSGGAHFQQFMSDSGTNDIESSVSPIYSLHAGYLPWDGTSFGLTASQTIGNSLQSDEHTESTMVSLEFRQRLLKNLSFAVTPNYSLTDYRSNTNPNAAANRVDEVLGISVSLSTVLFKKFAVSTFFSFADNQSDDEFYSYETRQFGFHIGYRF